MAKIKKYAWKSPGLLSLAYIVSLAIEALGFLGGALLTLLGGPSAQYGVNSEPESGLAILHMVFDVLVLALFLSIFIAIFWALRTSRNAHAVRRRMEYSPAAAVYWYLVPIASLINPFQVMSEIWVVSGGPKNPPLLKIWWALFLAGNILSTVTLALKIPSVDGVVSLISGFSALSFIVVVVRLRALQATSQSVADVFGEEE
ncbi:MAG: hypothetical protein JWM33_2990, partial [Caulobacteraceae bacterium]|nr:hypothetical protein [Caulobacteraceae bacterium]